jgi:hypothetical protein
MRFAQFALLALFPSFSACDGPTSVTEEAFSIRATGREVRLSNEAPKPTFYLIVERETAAVIDFMTCVQDPGCPNVASGTTVRVPYSEILGYRRGRREAIVFWWRSVLSPTGPQADGLRSAILEL